MTVNRTAYEFLASNVLLFPFGLKGRFPVACYVALIDDMSLGNLLAIDPPIPKRRDRPVLSTLDGTISEGGPGF